MPDTDISVDGGSDRPTPPTFRTVVIDRGSLQYARLALQAVIGFVVLVGALTTSVGPGGIRLVAGAFGGYAVAAAWHRWWTHRTGRTIGLGVLLSAAWLILLSGLSVLANVLPLAEGREPVNALLEPALLPPNLWSKHPLGTDSQALDVLAALLFGARVSITIAVGAVVIALIVGGTSGVLAGYFRGRLEAVVGFVTDSVLAFPALILLLALASVMKPTVLNMTLALGVLATPGTVRLARASTLAVASREFVTAARTLGTGTRRIIFREIVPSVTPPLIAYSFVIGGFLIVAEASLSFLGLGIQRPNPTWGNLISQGQGQLESHPWLVTLPSLFLFLTVMSANLIGQRLQQRWEL